MKDMQRKFLDVHKTMSGIKFSTPLQTPDDSSDLPTPIDDRLPKALKELIN